MTDIIKSVSKAFASTRDTRIDYHIVEKGSASLITGIYDQTDPITQGFYRKPDITGDGEQTKLAVIYGEVMITPYLIDAGVESSINDPSSVLKTYRFIAGDGVNSGVPNGPNGSPLENIYVKNPNQIPQPVVNSDGRPSLGNVILASSLGGAITSIPKLWDAIKGSTPASAQTKTVDPITGKPIASQAQQQAAALAKQIPIGELTDVNDTGKGDGYVLTYDVTQGMWVAKSINEALGNVLGGSTVCGGAGGTGGSGGVGGTGGAGGAGGGSTPTPVPETCYPVTSFVEYPCTVAPVITKSGMVLLPTLVNNTTNEYTQSINVLGTNGIELHFFAGGAGKRAIWKVAAGDTPNCPTTEPTLCLVDPNKATVEKPSGAAEVKYVEPASFDIQICITTLICGQEYLIYKTTFSETALSKTSYTFTAPVINWADTKVGTLLTKYPGQVWNSANPNIKLYLSRTDICGSEFDLHFEGYKRIIGDSYYRGVAQSNTQVPGTNTPQPMPIMVKADDGKFPDQQPQGGAMGVASCPAETELPGTAGEPGSPGTPGTGGGTGTPGAAGTCGEVTVAPAKAQPSILLASPCSKQYGTQTVPGTFDSITLPAVTIETKITDQNCNVKYNIAVGNGVFGLTGTLPSGVTSAVGDRSITLTGLASAIMTASALVKITPDSASKGEIHYTVILTNAETTRAGTACLLVPSQLTVKDSQSALAKVCVDASSTGGTGKVKITFNGKTLDLTDGFVAYTSNITATAAAIASNINANVAFKNALDPTDAAWLPDFQATAAAGEVNIAAPAAGGSDFNGVSLTTQVTGGFVFGSCNGTFLGGITSDITGFLKNNVPNWDKVSDVLLGVAGNVVGAVATNVIMSNASQLQVSLPTTDEVDVIFLYRGRVIKVPNEYNATARTGHPASYETWSGTWKQQYTNNPAWILYDFIINKRYGLGTDIVLSTAQETALLKDLFKIGAYCDQLVPDNSGVNQPRFSLNTVITEGTKMAILQQLCSVFHGAAMFVNGSLRIAIDTLDTAVKLLVNQANAGSFEKSFSSSKNFINKVRLSYVEPSNFYTEEIVVAEDTVSIAAYGEKSTDLIAFGCTNASQAQRYATWILKSEIENSINISYIGGLDHYNLIPGDIVEFYDSNERNIRRAGRIVSQSGVNVVLDAPIASVAGDYFSLTMSNGVIHQTTIASITGVNMVLTVAPVVAANPYATFIAAAVSQGRRLFKVIKIDETSNSKFSIALQLYATDKY